MKRQVSAAGRVSLLHFSSADSCFWYWRTIKSTRLACHWHGISSYCTKLPSFCFPFCFLRIIILLVMSSSHLRDQILPRSTSKPLFSHSTPSVTHSSLPAPQSFILRLRILELLPRRAELAQFVPHHILCHRDIVVDLAIVHLKFETHEVREDGCGTGLRFDGNLALSGFGASDGKAAGLRQRLSGNRRRKTHGTMLGPFQVDRARREGLRRMLRRLKVETRERRILCLQVNLLERYAR